MVATKVITFRAHTDDIRRLNDIRKAMDIRYGLTPSRNKVISSAIKLAHDQWTGGVVSEDAEVMPDVSQVNGVDPEALCRFSGV